MRLSHIHIHEGSPADIKWRNPDIDDEVGEIKRHASHFGITAERLKRVIESGKLVKMNGDMFKKLENTQMREINSIEDLKKRGEENDKKWEEIMRRIEAGKSLYAPIVVHQQGNPPWLVAGNTRLMAARAYNITPKIWYVKIEK
jgi:hypothetical protein